MKGSYAVLLALVLALFVWNAYGGVDVKNARPMQPQLEPTAVNSTPTPVRQSGGTTPEGVKTITWVAVDTMSNAYGPANSRVKAMAYNPSLNRAVVIHRGAATYGASGQLWYNQTSDGGATWLRVSEVNAGTPNLLRYPSCAISNPTNSSNPANAFFNWSAPRLAPAAFGGLSYGVDAPFAGGSPYAVASPDTGVSSQTAIWTHPSSDWVYWVTAANLYKLYRTQDYITVSQEVTPPTWQPSNFINDGTYFYGSATTAATYFGIYAAWPGDSLDDFNFGYSKSTDFGATWSGWTRPRPDWRRATGLPTSWNITDYVVDPGIYDYCGDLTFDANNRAHFFISVVDSPWTLTDPRGVMEVYETGTGWAYKWIQPDLHEQTNLLYGALDQTRNDIRAAISPDGTVMVVAWLDAGTSAATDTIPEIWGSFRRITDASWSAPQNLSQTPDYAELLLHVAPILRSNGGSSYTAFLGRTYEDGVTAYPPADANRSVFYAGTATIILGVKELPGLPTDYVLQQNFPNPFNPSTKIQYSIPKESFVTLKVYDVLGREVASLVNEVQKAGNFEADFNGSELSSGVYFYRLQAGEFVSVQKMTLMK